MQGQGAFAIPHENNNTSGNPGHTGHGHSGNGQGNGHASSQQHGQAQPQGQDTASGAAPGFSTAPAALRLRGGQGQTASPAKGQGHGGFSPTGTQGQQLTQDNMNHMNQQYLDKLESQLQYNRHPGNGSGAGGGHAQGGQGLTLPDASPIRNSRNKHGGSMDRGGGTHRQESMMYEDSSQGPGGMSQSLDVSADGDRSLMDRYVCVFVCMSLSVCLVEPGVEQCVSVICKCLSVCLSARVLCELGA